MTGPFNWGRAPTSIRWGERMMVASVAISADETVDLFAHEDAMRLVAPALLKMVGREPLLVLTTIEGALAKGHPASEVLDENSPIRDALRDAISGEGTWRSDVCTYPRCGPAAPKDGENCCGEPTWVLVPAEPTPKMLKAWLNEPTRTPAHEVDAASELADLAYAYRAMLAAAPTTGHPRTETARQALQDIESMAGGANGPTIRLRGFIDSMERQPGGPSIGNPGADPAMLRRPGSWLGYSAETVAQWARGDESERKAAAELTEPLYAASENVARLRGLLLWALYHNQGGSSAVGQPIRDALGIGQFDHLTPEQVGEATAWALLVSGAGAPR